MARIRGRVGMVITKRVYVTCIISIPAPLFKRGWHFVARFSHVCCQWRKIGQKAEDSPSLEPLVSRVEERLESLKSLPIYGLKKGQKYSLFMGQVHNAYIINTSFI